MPYPQRIVCLTEETTETLYLLGEGDRVVGVSGYTVRPPEARQKPRISSFLHARFDAIEALEPDLILAFSDLQADVTRELVSRGHMVVTFNQRSVDDILEMICMLGGIVGRADRAEQLASRLRAGLDRIREQSRELPRRPRVYFEEWNDPLISGIRWVDELVELAGGEPCFPALRREQGAKARIVTSDAVLAKDPECVIGSWCGKKFVPAKFAARPGFDAIPAVRDGFLREIKSALILQPGPAALTDGLDALERIVAEWAAQRPSRVA